MLYDKRWGPKAPVKPKLAGWQQVLLNAADLIEKEGWVTRHHHVEGRGYCARGAIFYAEGSKLSKMQAIVHLRRHLGNICGGRMSIVLWNDAGLQYKASVIGALRDAAR